MNIFMRLRFPFGQIKTFKLPDLGESKFYIYMKKKSKKLQSKSGMFKLVIRLMR